MSQIMNATDAKTMSSREIAELCEKRHDHVMRDIRDMLVQLHGKEGIPRFGNTYLNAQNGQIYPSFALPKRETLLLVSGYRLDIRAKIIDRWQQLEADATIDIAVALSNPANLRKLLLDNVEKVLALQGEVEEMRPQVQALERIAISEGSLCITDAAKTLQVQPKALFRFLDAYSWTYARQGDGTRIAYQAKLQSGLLEHKTMVVTRSDGFEKTTTQVRVTPKGLTRLAKEFPPVASAA